MNYKLLGEFDELHLIKTNKFKTLFFKIVFTSKVKKEEITIRNLLVDNLNFSCKSYPSKRQMNIKKQDLYGADVYALNKRIGNYFVTEFSLSMLNPKYTEDGMLDASFDFFHDIIFNPNVEDNHFNNEVFNLSKENMKESIKSIRENPNLYINRKLKESLGDYPFSYQMDGYLEDLDSINSFSLYSYYKEFLSNNNIDIFVIGDFDEKKILDIINSKFNFNINNKVIDDFSIDYRNTKRKIKEIEENSLFNQTKLAISCSLGRLTNKEKKYVAVLYNIILGNSPDSKFFKNIREKKSYAYTISSGFRRADDILIINAGISIENTSNVITSIKKEMEDMQNGIFSDLDLEKARSLYISVINEVYEYQSSISEYYYNLKYLSLDKYEKEIKEVNSIRKEDVIKLAKKIKIDTIYLLKEEEHGKD